MNYLMQTLILGLFCFNLDYTFTDENKDYYGLNKSFPRFLFCLLFCAIPVIRVVFIILCILGTIRSITERMCKNKK